MARSHNYVQTVLGMCGHVCMAWPSIRRLGFGPDSDEVICDTCTRERYRISESEPLDVWVRIDAAATEEAKPVKTKRKPRVKAVTCSLCRSKGHLYSECPLTTEVLV